MKLYHLQANHLNQPMGICPKGIRLSWKLEGCKAQTAFRVEITSAGETIYDSEKTDSSKMHFTLPQDLKSRGTYEVTVTAFGDDGASASASLPLVTGIDRSQWQAKWINPELSCDPDAKKRAAYLVKNFSLTSEQIAEAKEKAAYIYATAHGVMNLYLNDRDVSENQLMPGTQQYNKRLMVETLPVADLLKEGENTLVVTLGDGWYRGCMANDQHHNVYGTDIALLLQLEIGGQPVLISDESWQATSEGPLGLNDFMKGEEYDATRTLDDLHPVKVESFGFENLIALDTVHMTPHERFSAKLMTTPNGETVLDFGQNISGYVELSFSGTAGKQLVLTHGEALDSDGNFTIANFQSRAVSTDQKVTYICKDGENHYHPTKIYLGFRYAKVEADFEIQPEWFTAVAVYSDMDVVSQFECGVPEVNQYFKNAIWSMKGNFMDVPTDCPTREKSGYSGDCQAYVHAATYFMDCYSVYAKWLREQAAGQYPDGNVPQICPKPVPPQEYQKMLGKMMLDGGIGWADSFEIVPTALFAQYGDDTLIAENYEAIKAWTEYEIKRASKTRMGNHKLLPRKHRKYMIDTGWMWGEWLEPEQDDVNYMKNLIFHGDPEVGTAFFYLNLKQVEAMADHLGKAEDAKRYHDLAEKAKAAYRAVYTKDGEITEEKRQCRYVRPIAHDLLSEEEKKAAAAKLANMVHANGDHLGTGFLTTHELCRSLSSYGQTKTAYDLLLQKGMPGFLYAVTLGCTTIPEEWDCLDPDGNPKASYNHYSYGATAGWLMDSALGIRIEGDTIAIEPHTDERLGFAKGCYDSPYGKVTSAWEYENGKVTYRITAPANSRAYAMIDGQRYELEPEKELVITCLPAKEA